MDQNPPLKLLAAFKEVFSKVGYIQKADKNKFQDYTYLSCERLVEAIRSNMQDAGITISTHISEIVDCSASDKIKDGSVTGTNFRLVAIYTFRFVHFESGETWETQAIGEGVDSGDKSAYKAATGALKYALRQALMIATGDDPEDEYEQKKAAELDKETSAQKLYREVEEQMNLATTPDALRKTWGDNEAELRLRLKNDFPAQYAEIRKQLSSAMSALKKEEAKVNGVDLDQTPQHEEAAQ